MQVAAGAWLLSWKSRAASSWCHVADPPHRRHHFAILLKSLLAAAVALRERERELDLTYRLVAQADG